MYGNVMYELTHGGQAEMGKWENRSGEHSSRMDPE